MASDHRHTTCNLPLDVGSLLHIPASFLYLLKGSPEPRVMAYDAANTLIKAISMAIEHGDERPLAFVRAQTGEYLVTLLLPGWTGISCGTLSGEGHSAPRLEALG
jgi:hypothetical protein